jgi:hypothetical protein
MNGVWNTQSLPPYAAPASPRSAGSPRSRKTACRRGPASSSSSAMPAPTCSAASPRSVPPRRAPWTTGRATWSPPSPPSSTQKPSTPLGLNIHPIYGLWHAYRAALLFPVEFDIPVQSPGPHPCEPCAAKPCLSACPVNAFDGTSYDVPACASHIATGTGETCMIHGCLARHACPVGQNHAYAPAQAAFHMRAFLAARQKV